MNSFTAAAAFWTFELLGGTAYNVPRPLTIRQDNQPAVHLDAARYRTRPTGDRAPYYAMRIGRWKDGKAWELEHLHHKLYLDNKPPEVDVFLMTFGYNHYLINRAWLRDGWIWRLGAGIIITHPESEVRDREFTGRHGFIGPYYLSGAAAQASLGRQLPLTSRLSAVLEGKLAVSKARVPISAGHADLSNISLHALAGLSYKF